LAKKTWKMVAEEIVMNYMIRKKPKKPKFDEINGTYRADYGEKTPLGVVAIIEDEDDE